MNLISCSPVDKVKWSKINLLGNEIPVWKVTGGICGSSGTVEWSRDGQSSNREYEIVSAKISRKGQQYLLRFSYDNNKRECQLIDYRVNGKPESPFYIYKFMTVNHYRFLPDFIDLIFDPAAEH